MGVVAPFQLYFLVKNGFRSLYLKRLVYWIHILYTGVYIIIKYRSSSILGIIRLLLWEFIAPFWFCIHCFVRSLEFHIRSITTLWICFHDTSQICKAGKVNI